MDIQAQLAAAARARYKQMNGIEASPPPASTMKKKIKEPLHIPKANPGSKNAAKSAAAAAIAAKLGNKSAPPPAPRGPPPPLISGPRRVSPAPANPASTGGGPLNDSDEAIAAQYRKMMKIGMPEGAVRHKMASDGVPNHIADYVISGGASGPPKPKASMPSADSSMRGPEASLSAEEEKIASQYRKMMKIGMPEGAIRHKMNLDGVSANIQESVIAGESSPPAPSTTNKSSGGGRSGGGPTSSLSPNEEKIASQYRKMMKIGMPEGAVRHKMTADGVSPKIQDSVIAGEVAAPASSSASESTRATGNNAAGPISSLMPQEEQIATPYRKMMKINMPEGAIIHKMNIDGVAKKIQDSVLKGETPASEPTERPAPTASALPVNPMAAAIASSGGIGSLKKAAPAEEGSSQAMTGKPSNPLAAAIAASGGQGALKKAAPKKHQNKPPKQASLDSISAELAAMGFQSALKKTPNKSNYLEPSKPSSISSLAGELASVRFTSGFKKTPQKENRLPPGRSHSNDADLARMLEQRKAKSNSNRETTSIETVQQEQKAGSGPKQAKNFLGISKIEAILKAQQKQKSLPGQEKVQVAPALAYSPKSSPVAPTKSSNVKNSEKAPATVAPAIKTSPPAARVKNNPPATSEKTATQPARSQVTAASQATATKKAIASPAPALPPAFAAVKPPTMVAYSPVIPSKVSESRKPLTETASNPSVTQHKVALAPVPEPKRPLETKTEKVTDLGSGKKVIEATTVTMNDDMQGAKRTRERKTQKTKNSDKKKKSKPQDTGVDHHCQCVVM